MDAAQRLCHHTKQSRIAAVGRIAHPACRKPRRCAAPFIVRTCNALPALGGSDDPPQPPGGSSQHDPGVPQPGRPWSWWLQRLLHAALSYLVLLVGAATLTDLYYDTTLPRIDASGETVTIIIPALNEERMIGDTVALARQLGPLEVIVVDGGSSDGTVSAARRAGARVVTGAGRGRGRQMNAGADVSKGSVLCFLHADTRLPADAVEQLRSALSDTRTVLVGFKPQIQGSRGVLAFSSLHNLVKTWYGPLLFRPMAWVCGLRLLFGDQALSCRTADFRAVRGFRSEIPIMEDAELCLALHGAGPAPPTTAAAAAAPYQGPGRVRMLCGSGPAVTSGRRIEAWGELRATWIFAVVALRWLCGAPPAELRQLYATLYTDRYR